MGAVCTRFQKEPTTCPRVNNNVNKARPSCEFEGNDNEKRSRLPSQVKGAGVKTFPHKNQLNAHFNALRDTDKLLVLDFTATWCGPCQIMSPILDAFAEKYSDVEFIKIDVDQLPDVAAEFGIQSVPTYLLFKKGHQVDRVEGASKDDLQTKIEKHRK